MLDYIYKKNNKSTAVARPQGTITNKILFNIIGEKE